MSHPTCALFIVRTYLPVSPLYLLGYIPSHNRIYLVDRQMSIFAYSLSLAVVEYQTAILRRDFVAAAELLHTVPAGERNKVARFLEAQGE